MGNSASSGRSPHDDTVDFGHLTPQGIYAGQRDWNEAIVGQFICDRKLAPFYRPLEDYEPSWDDERILAARKEPPSPSGDGNDSSSRQESSSTTSRIGHHKRPSNVKDLARSPDAAIYRGAVECPICFLYYPPNINKSRCCDQAICTECFVQIKRSEPTVTHLQSDPACCPYCVQENFGILYTPPSWRAGIGSEGSSPPSWPEHAMHEQPPIGKQKRRKSFGADNPDVVTTDQIRPDWEAKLQAVKAAAARRANRRIIMRQVGDRLIPVGVTSGRVHALPAEGGDGASTDSAGGRRSRRRQQNEFNQLLGSMGLGGQDLEELMVMEAMRLSLLEHEDQQRREAQQRTQNGGEGASTTQSPAPQPSTQSSTENVSSSPISNIPPSAISISYNVNGDRVPAASQSASPSPVYPPPASDPSSRTPTESAPSSPARTQPTSGLAAPVIVPSPEPVDQPTADGDSGKQRAVNGDATIDPDATPLPPPAGPSSSSTKDSLVVPVDIDSRQTSIGSSVASESFDPMSPAEGQVQEGGIKGKGKEKETLGYSMLPSSEESLVARRPLLRSETVASMMTEGDGDEIVRGHEQEVAM